MILRPYQRLAIDMTYDWFAAGNSGHPCIVIPTAGGKSHIIAEFCKETIQNWPETRILLATHVKELIEQDLDKMLGHWPEAPVGIYSAGMKSRQLSEPITFASIQSIRNRAEEIGHIDIFLVDEAHLISHKEQGGYRKLVAALTKINPNMRVIGFTATAYRLGHGMITTKPALFDALIEPVSIEELVHHNYLAPLHSKNTEAKLDVSGVHKRGGEYIESELQKAVDTEDNNTGVIVEILARAGDRTSWLVFCSGVRHAERIRDRLDQAGISARCVFGTTSKKDREGTFAWFKEPHTEPRALVGANVFTTGFDAPNVDLIAQLRPTASPGLYVQMSGRGMRIKEHTDHCKVLDFAGNVARHGPITLIRPPDKKRKGNGECPVKVCDKCQELCPLACRECPACGHPFPEPERPKLKLRNDDIMGLGNSDMTISRWYWSRHISYSSGKEMLLVSYYGEVSQEPVSEYFPVRHEGYAGQRAREQIIKIVKNFSQELQQEIFAYDDLNEVADILNRCPYPRDINFRKDGKFFRVTRRTWETDSEQSMKNNETSSAGSDKTTTPLKLSPFRTGDTGDWQPRRE